MREILFRGKKSDGKWEYGNLYILGECAFIISELGFQKKVDTETVGQFTGLTDKNGTKIFEGDIIKTPRGIGKVEFETATYFVTYNKPVVENWLGDLLFVCVDELREIEVIGNIHDNPELLVDNTPK